MQLRVSRAHTTGGATFPQSHSYLTSFLCSSTPSIYCGLNGTQSLASSELETLARLDSWSPAPGRGDNGRVPDDERTAVLVWIVACQAVCRLFPGTGPWSFSFGSACSGATLVLIKVIPPIISSSGVCISRLPMIPRCLQLLSTDVTGN